MCAVARLRAPIFKSGIEPGHPGGQVHFENSKWVFFKHFQRSNSLFLWGFCNTHGYYKTPRGIMDGSIAANFRRVAWFEVSPANLATHAAHLTTPLQTWPFPCKPEHPSKSRRNGPIHYSSGGFVVPMGTTKTPEE